MTWGPEWGVGLQGEVWVSIQRMPKTTHRGVNISPMGYLFTDVSPAPIRVPGKWQVLSKYS